MTQNKDTPNQDTTERDTKFRHMIKTSNLVTQTISEINTQLTDTTSRHTYTCIHTYTQIANPNQDTQARRKHTTPNKTQSQDSEHICLSGNSSRPTLQLVLGSTIKSNRTEENQTEPNLNRTEPIRTGPDRSEPD